MEISDTENCTTGQDNKEKTSHYQHTRNSHLRAVLSFWHHLKNMVSWRGGIIHTPKKMFLKKLQN